MPHCVENCDFVQITAVSTNICVGNGIGTSAKDLYNNASFLRMERISSELCPTKAYFATVYLSTILLNILLKYLHVFLLITITTYRHLIGLLGSKFKYDHLNLEQS